MLDKNKLNRVKKVLSAGGGTLVPILFNSWKEKPGNEYKNWADYVNEVFAPSKNLEESNSFLGTSENEEQTVPFRKGYGIYKAPWEGYDSKTDLLKKLREGAVPNEVLLQSLAAVNNSSSSAATNLTAAQPVKAPVPEPALDIVTPDPATTQNTAGNGSPAESVEAPVLENPAAGSTQEGAAAGLELSLVDYLKEKDRTLAEQQALDAQLRALQLAEQLAQQAELAAAAKKAGIRNSALSGAAQGIDMASNLFVDKSDFADDDPTLGKGRQVYDSVANSMMGFSPVGTIIGGAMKAVGLVNDMLGSSADKFAIDKDTIEKVGGSYGGATQDINEAASKSGKKYGLFAGSARRNANRAMEEARRKQGLMANIASEATDRRLVGTLTDPAAHSYRLLLKGGYDLRYTRAAKLGGALQLEDDFEIILSNPEDTEVFKLGGSFTPIVEILEDDWDPIITDEISEFKTGGKLRKNEEGKTVPEKCDECGGEIVVKIQGEPVYLCKECNKYFGVVPFKHKDGGTIKDTEIEVIETNTSQKSVIPEGALHKNKHHLDLVGVDDSELTKKGIPVIDNNGDLLAEIELNEIIFTLEVTKELEKRYKEFYEEETSNDRKNELALEAGKLLWKEIIYNTDDRTGLIDTLKQGGVLKAQDGIQVPDKLRVEKPKVIDPKLINIKEISKKLPYNLWLKMVPKEWQSENYDLETAYKYLPLEQLNRWLFAINSENPDYYMNYLDPNTGEYIYHLGSIAPYGEGEYIFLKKGKEDTNPELHWETDTYHNGSNGLKETHDLVYDEKESRYFYRKKKKTTKHSFGGELSGDIDFIKYKPVSSLSVIQNTGTSSILKLINELLPAVQDSDILETVAETETTLVLNETLEKSPELQRKLLGIANLSFMEMVEKYGEGVIKVGNTHLRPQNASYGVKNSWHKLAHPTWKNSDGTPMPMAFDLTPTKGHTFTDLWRVLGKPEWLLWLASQNNGRGGKGWGVVDESTDAIRSTHNWVSTGNHIHLGAGSSAWSQYANAMKKYNNLNINNIVENYLASLLEDSKKPEDTKHDNVIRINKTNRTLSVNGKTYKVSISIKGTDNSKQIGDNLTPEGIFGLDKGFKHAPYTEEPNRTGAFGNWFLRLKSESSNVARRGIAIHGSDWGNDPDSYEVGKIGTHGCIAMKNLDMEELKSIIALAGGEDKFKVEITKSEKGGVIQKHSSGGISSMLTDLFSNVEYKPTASTSTSILPSLNSKTPEQFLNELLPELTKPLPKTTVVELPVVLEPSQLLESTQTNETSLSGKWQISEEMFLHLLKKEGTQNFVAHTHPEFGESFVTGPYGMVYKHIDENGNLLSHPLKFLNGEKVSPEYAKANARAYYNKIVAEWQNLLLGKPGVTQSKLDALVSASNGTVRSKKSLLLFVLTNWGDDLKIAEKLRTFATTAAGNGKVMPGLVTRRKFEADWYLKGATNNLNFQKAEKGGVLNTIDFQKIRNLKSTWI